MTDTNPQQADRRAPQSDRARLVAAIKSAPFEELRSESPNGPLVITARVDDLADAVLRAAATVPASAPTDQAALRSDLEDALKGAGVYDSKERMWHSLSPEWIEEILTEVLAVLPAPAACSDPIECSHEAALGQAEAAVARVRSVLESEAVVGRSALDYRGLITTALMADQAPASDPGGVAGETQQPERPRCPHCQMPHDLTPDVAAVCASIRASIAEQPAAVARPDGEA
jgi:hypothetical protein